MPAGSGNRAHFSMIRQFHLADVFTLANGALGTGAVLAFMRFLVDGRSSFFWLGAALLPVALVMDALDGRIARWRGVASPLGQDLDSLADVISFGVAPAALAFAVGMRGGWDALLLIYFVGCGISRLARYNVTASAAAAARGKVKYFEGIPDPDQPAARRRARVRSSAGPDGRTRSRWAPSRSARRDAASSQPAVRPARQRDDQQDAAHPQALTIAATKKRVCGGGSARMTGATPPRSRPG